MGKYAMHEALFFEILDRRSRKSKSFEETKQVIFNMLLRNKLFCRYIYKGINMYILIWLFLAILGVIIITFNFLENNTTNKNDKNIFKKFIPDIENSFYNVQATWTDIIFIHLSILTLMRFLLDLFSDSIDYFPQLNTYFGSFSSVLFASIHFLLYLLLWYLFVASGGKLAYTLGRRKKHTAKGEVDSFSNCCAFFVVSIYMVLLIIFMLV